LTQSAETLLQMPLSAAKLVDRYGESVGTVAGF
jgi:hypothetical protein